MVNENGVGGSETDAFVVDSMDVVRIKLVRNEAEIEDEKELQTEELEETGFAPQFTHQQFGENEKIVGYKRPRIQVLYNAASLDVHIRLVYDATITEQTASMQPDDVQKAISDFLLSPPVSMDGFRASVRHASAFKPFGEKLHEYTSTNVGDALKRRFEVWYVDWSAAEGSKDHVGRVQSIAFWFIDGVNYTEADDPKWAHFITYEVVADSSGETQSYYLVGYASVYNYYAYPEHIRPRIGHILVLPPFRKSGHGIHLIQSIYNYFIPNNQVVDITAEEPSDFFSNLRDYVDAVNARSLQSFQPDSLKKGFSESMVTEAKLKLRMPKKQSRKAYEILRLKATNSSDATELKAYRLDVKRRLNQQYKKNERSWTRVKDSLESEELTACAAASDERMQLLQRDYEQTLERYRHILDRLDTYADDCPCVAKTSPPAVANGTHRE